MSEDIKNQDEVTEASAPVANKGVVAPDKDPVPKSLASVDKAADGTKPSKKRKGDQDKKDAPQKLAAASNTTFALFLKSSERSSPSTKALTSSDIS